MDEDGRGRRNGKKVEGDGEKKEEEEIHQFIYPENEGRKKKRHIVCISHSESFSTCLLVYYFKLIEEIQYKCHMYSLLCLPEYACSCFHPPVIVPF